MNKVSSLHKSLISLTLFYALILLVVLTLGTSYWYDEVIVTQISKMEVNELMDTIKAEPHPPGFYYLLKLLPTQNPKYTRATVILITYFLSLIAIIYSDKSGLTKKYRLKFPLLLLTSSPAWMYVATSIKQDSVSLPLFLLTALLLLKYMLDPKGKSLFLAVATTLCILILGYINFVKAFILLAVVVIKKPIKPSAVLLLGAVSVAFALIATTVGAEQFQLNQNRFSWQGDEVRTPMKVSYLSIGGILSKKKDFYLSEIVFLTSLLLAFKAKKNLNGLTTKKVWLFIIVGFIFYSFSFGIARERYISELIIAMFLVVGWGLEDLYSKSGEHRHLAVGFVTLFQINSILNFVAINQGYLNYELVSKKIGELASTELTGVIDRHPIEAFVRKQGYFSQSEKAIPLSLFTPVKANAKISKSTLLYDGNFIYKNNESVIEKLKESNSDRFVYTVTDTDTWGNFEYYYDQDQVALSILNRCSQKELITVKNRFLIVYKDCGFQNSGPQQTH